MTSITLEDAQARLRQIIAELTPGEQLVIVENGEAVATLARGESRRWPCKAGSAKHTPHWMAADFDAPLDDFREYME